MAWSKIVQKGLYYGFKKAGNTTLFNEYLNYRGYKKDY